MNSGNYDIVIRDAVDRLRRNKGKKSNQPYVINLEHAFAKAVARDKKTISFLETEGNNENLEKIYNTN